MSKWFKENGSLSDEGKLALNDFNFGIAMTLLTDEAQNMTVDELRVLGSNLQKILGDVISERIQIINNKEHAPVTDLKKMSPKDFNIYLENKYGPQYMFVSLTPEELEACPVPTENDFRQALEEGAKASQAMFDATKRISFPNPRTRYR